MFLEGLLGRPSSFLVDSRKNKATYKPCHKHMDIVSTAVWEVVHPAADCPFNHWATQVPLSLFPLWSPCPPPVPIVPIVPPFPSGVPHTSIADEHPRLRRVCPGTCGEPDSPWKG